MTFIRTGEKTSFNKTTDKMKKIQFLSIVFSTLFPFVFSVVFPGPCPDLTTVNNDFECISMITSGSYRAVAYLPVDGTTLNIFFNPFITINCLELNIQCSYAETRNIQIRYNCYPTISSNKTLGIVTQCLPITFDPYRQENNKTNQISS